MNPNMVYVAGFSSGAEMAERVGVEISEHGGGNCLPLRANGACKGSAPPLACRPPGPRFPPISVQEWHGTLDKELPPCNYGTTLYSGVTSTLDTVDDTFNYWAGPNSQ